MKNIGRTIGIIAGSTLVIGGITWIVVNNIKNKKIIKEVNRLIDTNTTPDTYALNFFRSDYRDKLPKGKNIIEMPNAETAKWITQLKNAFGMFSDNEDGVYSVFRALKDGVAVNQVATAYQKTFSTTTNPVSLLDVLKGKLNKAEMEKVLEILNEKPPYGYK